MADFQLRHHNRRHFPKRHVIVVEDDIENQLRFAAWASARFDGQGEVQFDFVCSAVAVAAILKNLKPNLIILDHDLPMGNGSDLLTWMGKEGIKDIPVITASGIPNNNKHMASLAEQQGIECYLYEKIQVYLGEADQKIASILNRKGNNE